MCTINVLGPLVLSIDGQVLHLPRKARALLAYLVVTQGQVPRSRLADLLWPYQSSEQARHSLRNCLLEARKAISDIIRADMADCWLSDAVTSDLTGFRVLARSHERARLSQACETYRGEFLDGFELVSEPWNEWLEAQREVLKRLATDALARYSELSSAAGLHKAAVDAAQRLIAIEPYSEVFHQRLMLALVAGGRRSEAIHHYKKFDKFLRAELGVPPGPEAQRLLNEIVAGGGVAEPIEVAAPPAPVPAPVPARVTPFPRQPTRADDLTKRLEGLASQIAAWKAGTGRLTRPMIDRIEVAMLAAAADRRRNAVLEEEMLDEDPHTAEIIALIPRSEACAAQL